MRKLILNATLSRSSPGFYLHGYQRLDNICAVESRAGHFRHFLIFSMIKHFMHFFYQVNNLFLHQSYLKTPCQINLIKNAKNHFLLLKKFKNTSRAQLWDSSMFMIAKLSGHKRNLSVRKFAPYELK